jgi:hypothetical protein
MMGCCAGDKEPLGVIKDARFLGQLSDHFLRRLQYNVGLLRQVSKCMFCIHFTVY